MNTPVHFKQQLVDELNAHATLLPDPAGHRVPVRLRAPRRRTAFAMGAVAAAAAVVVAVPLASGAHRTPQAAPAQHSTAVAGPAAAGPGAPGPQSVPGAGGLNIVNADYAVQSKPGGLVAVQLFSPKGVPGLRAALRRAGIPAVVMTPSASCHATIQYDDRRHSGGPEVLPPGLRSGPDGLYQLIRPSAIPAGDILLFTASFGGPSQELGVTLVRQVPSCVPSV